VTGLTKFKIVTEGQRLMLELMEQVMKVHDYHATHGLPIPDELARFLGEDPATGQLATRMIIPPMPSPEVPESALPSWIWVREEVAAPNTLVLALLKQASKTLSRLELVSEMDKKRPGINKGTIANVGTRFEDEKLISRSDDGWTLLRPDLAPVLYRGHLWGEPSVFEKSEAASYRRCAVQHVLRSFPRGLQIVEITETLKENCPWLNSDIPVSKDLVKMDMRDLEQDGLAKRKATGKWEVTE
jgi:hypothetical protein